MNKEKIQKQFQLLKQSEQLYQERESKSKQLNQLVQQYRNKGEPQAIHELKKEISFLDHLLDEISPDAEINQREILLRLISNILQNEPSRLPSYQLIQEKENELERSRRELQPLAILIQKYHQIFQRAASHLSQSKKRPLLASLFGRHPKVLLSYEIATIAKEGKVDLPQLRSMQVSELQKEFLILLEKVVEEANKKWNHALYERSFYDFVATSHQIYNQLLALLEKERHSAALIAQEKEQWINASLK